MGEVSPWAFNGVADGPEQRTLSSLPFPLGDRGFHSGFAVQRLQSLTAAKLSQGRGAGMGPGARPSVLGLTSGGRAEADLGYGSARWRLLLFRVGTSDAGRIVLLRGSHRSGARRLRWGRGCRGCSSSPLLLSRATTGCFSPPNHFGECSPRPRYSTAAGRHGTSQRELGTVPQGWRGLLRRAAHLPAPPPRGYHPFHLSRKKLSCFYPWLSQLVLSIQPGPVFLKDRVSTSSSPLPVLPLP